MGDQKVIAAVTPVVGEDMKQVFYRLTTLSCPLIAVPFCDISTRLKNVRYSNKWIFFVLKIYSGIKLTLTVQVLISKSLCHQYSARLADSTCLWAAQLNFFLLIFQKLKIESFKNIVV